MYKLTCCTTVDLPKEYISEEGIVALPFHFFVNGKEYLDDFYSSITPKEYFDLVAKENVTTSQVSPEQYEKTWSKILDEGSDIIHITLSTGISGTYNSACIAKKNLLEKYVGRKIEIIDSKCASTGYGLLYYLANEKMKSGANFEEMVSFINNEIQHIEHLFYSTDLSMYVKGGRLSKAEGMIGSILNICPFLKTDVDGKLKLIGKARGVKKAREQIIELMKQNIVGSTNYNGHIFICHSDYEIEANEMLNLIKENFSNAIFSKYTVCNVGTTIGAHTGRGTVAIFYECEKRL